MQARVKWEGIGYNGGNEKAYVVVKGWVQRAIRTICKRSGESWRVVTVRRELERGRRG